MKLMLKTLFFNENSIYNNSSIIANHQNIIPMAYRAIFHQKFIFVKLMLVLQSNRIINFTNSEVEPLCVKVGEAQDSPTNPKFS
jgi:hypothetical protein